jgi:putative hydrolase of the HAD superfamily
MPSANSAPNRRIEVRGVIFDYGNVLCHPQQPSDIESMARVCGVAAAGFRDLYWKFRVAYDRADLNGEAYWTAVAREEGVALSPDQVARLIALDTASWARENDAVVCWVEQLHDAGFSLALLSNMPSELSRTLSAQGKWAKFFPHRVFSCDVRRNKPNPLIYQTCLDTLQLAANDVLFLDDIPANVEAASRLGIHGLVFDTLERTLARVAETFNLPVPVAFAPSQPG